MPISLTSGVAGIKTRDWKVYVSDDLDYPYSNVESVNELNGVTSNISGYSSTGIGDVDSYEISSLDKVYNISECNRSIVLSFNESLTPTSSSFVVLNVQDIGTFGRIHNSSSSIDITENGIYYIAYDDVEEEFYIKNVGHSKIGELEKASIEPMLENGESIEGNEVGQIYLNKTGTLSFVLVNVLLANINGLESIDKSIVNFLLISKENDMAISIPNCSFNYQESFQSGQVQRLPISITKEVEDASMFRSIYEISLT